MDPVSYICSSTPSLKDICSTFKKGAFLFWSISPILKLVKEAIENLKGRFDVLHRRWLASINNEGWPVENSQRIIRSAAKVEQAFGGLNAQLWDDPHEWTLPEALGSREKAVKYLSEVSKAADAGFARLVSDGDLSRELWTPWGQMEIRSLLERTFDAAESLLDRE